MAKRQVEVFTAGCPVCEPAVQLVKELACPDCEVTVQELGGTDGSGSAAADEAAEYRPLDEISFPADPRDGVG